MQIGLLVSVFSIGQVVYDHLILIMLVLELEHVIGSFFLSLLRLLDDRERVNILTNFQLTIGDTKFLNLCIRLTKFLLHFCLIGWILFELVQARLHLLSLLVERLGVQISFLDLLVEIARVALDSCELRTRHLISFEASSHGWLFRRRMAE